MLRRPMVPISCLLDVPPAFAPKARYAWVELLRPLGLEPSFREDEDEEAPGLYYGPHPERSGARLALGCAPETPAFFERPRPLDRAWVRWLEWDGERWPVPIGSRAERGPFAGLDLVASAFWWLSGWQEAATRQRDVHGRFPFSASLQAALGTAHLPAVDAYRCALADALREAGIEPTPARWGTEEKPWAVLLSHDVDRVRRRRLGTLARGVAGGDPVGALRRALAPGNVDLDGLAALLREAEARGGRATVFAKAGRTGRLDAPYRLGRQVRAALREALRDGHDVGLHPSTFAMRHPRHLLRELDRLRRAIQTVPMIVRAHYLRFDPLRAPADLQRVGFVADASLGFSEAPGYRRGTGRPFPLWDLQADRPAPLLEVPLAVMDTTLLGHLGMTPREAADAALQVLRGARRTGSAAAVLWHNRPLDEPDGRDALAAYRLVLDAARSDGAALLPLEAVLPIERGAFNVALRRRA